MMDAEDLTPDSFDAMIKKTQGSSAYRNDRDRPYNGQAHTHDGSRGHNEVKGITFRDLADCIVQGFLASTDPELGLQNKTVEINDEFKGTEYASNNSWRVDDLYGFDLDTLDPVAVIQNTICFVEHYMGIYPNVPSLKSK